MIELLLSNKKILILIAFIAVLAGEYFYVKHQSNQECQMKLQLLQNEFDKKVAAAQQELHNKEMQLNDMTIKLEKQNVEAKKQIQTINRKYAEYVKSHGGLRDPGKPNSSTNTNGNSNSTPATQSAESAGDRKLSDEATKFLLDLTAEADELKADYSTCYEWANKVQEILKTPHTKTNQQ